MSIKTKLVLSNIAMCVIPLVLCIFTFVGLNNLYNKKLYSYYSIDTRRERPFLNPYMELKFIDMKQFDYIQKQLDAVPDDFLNGNFLKDLNKSLVQKNSYIIVEKNDKIIFNGGSKNNKKLLNEIVNANYSTRKEKFRESQNIYDDSNLIVKQIKFVFSNGKEGNLFFIIDSSKLLEISKEFVIAIIISIILIVCLTSGFITFLVSRSIIIPLKQLKVGTEQIRDGNLNFEVKAESKDEIGEVCEAFDDMRKKLKESIELQIQYEDNRKELISNISHDLKTPLTAIKGYVEGIKDGVADTPQKMDKYINTIYNKTQSMDHLIEELLTYSKLDLKKLPFHFIDIDFVKYMSDIMEECRFDVEKNGMEFYYNNLAKGKIITHIDVQSISRVITNIISNSIKYMNKAEGKISVEMSSDDEYVTVKVKDNGKGISEEALPYIFDRFYREDSSRNTLHGGSGLGLAICKKIIDEHGGRVGAKSKKDIGTEIWFSIKINKLES
ncbi:MULTISPECIES: sensor histidine kinase [Clostridium]|uniref:sensor histidine kinase n=1 Tax=Clostridium TaxID=1485 RepID=UPI0008247F15|nr:MULTISPECIES: HAMP domain-containing sensor histidine kinase [Clostridium]PJI08038.1 sensor histidine kinase [Clostridium sp. CT7]